MIQFLDKIYNKGQERPCFEQQSSCANLSRFPSRKHRTKTHNIAHLASIELKLNNNIALRTLSRDGITQEEKKLDFSVSKMPAPSESAPELNKMSTQMKYDE